MTDLEIITQKILFHQQPRTDKKEKKNIELQFFALLQLVFFFFLGSIDSVLRASFYFLPSWIQFKYDWIKRDEKGVEIMDGVSVMQSLLNIS